jgi:hypothetical protein
MRMNVRSSGTRFISLSLTPALPFSQSRASVDPHFYCRLRYVEGTNPVASFLRHSYYFGVLFPMQPATSGLIMQQQSLMSQVRPALEAGLMPSAKT